MNKTASLIDHSSRIVRSTLGRRVQVREYCAIHDSTLRDGCKIYERVSIKKSDLGRSVTVNAGTYIERARVEDGVLIGPNCSIVGMFHEFSRRGVLRKDSINPVVIRRGAFLGAGCVVLPGREIGRNAVIGAGAIVAHDVPPRHTVVGVPPHQTVTPISGATPSERISRRGS